MNLTDKFPNRFVNRTRLWGVLLKTACQPRLPWRQRNGTRYWPTHRHLSHLGEIQMYFNPRCHAVLECFFLQAVVFLEFRFWQMVASVS